MEDAMAHDGDGGEGNELMGKLNKEFEEHLKNVMEKNKDFEYDSGFTPENIDEKLRLIPAFINETPTQEEIDASPALAALQALKYEETDPEESARAHKEDGNYHFKHKEYKKAIIAYTEALKQKFSDIDLKVILMTNRAAAHFHLENHRSSLNDAKEALKLNKEHKKALIRAAMCCFELKLYEDCTRFCDDGLQVDSNEKRLCSLRMQASDEKKKQERDKRKMEKKNKAVLEKQRKLVNAIKERGVTIEKPAKCDDYDDDDNSDLELFQWIRFAASDQPQRDKIYVDDKNELHWPVYFLYPEFNQSDFIEDFHENHRFLDHLVVMFDQNSLPDWDEKKLYLWKNLEMYFEDKHRELLVKIHSSKSLKEVLSDKRFRVINGAPTFLVLSSASNFFKDFSKSISVEDF